MRKYSRTLILFLVISLGTLAIVSIYPHDFFLSDQVFKKDSRYEVKHTFFQYNIFFKPEKNQDLISLIPHLDQELLNEKGWFKNNKKRTVSLIPYGDSSFFVKRYNYSNLIDYCSKIPFCSSQAFRSFYYGFHLKKNNVNTPQPIALIEKRIGFFWTKSYIIFKKIEGKSLEELIKEKSENADLLNSEKNAKDLAHLFTVLKKNKWIHRDLTFRNIFYANEELYFLDLDEMHSYFFDNIYYRKKFEKKHVKKMIKDAENSHLNLQKSFSLPI